MKNYCNVEDMKDLGDHQAGNEIQRPRPPAFGRGQKDLKSQAQVEPRETFGCRDCSVSDDSKRNGDESHEDSVQGE